MKIRHVVAIVKVGFIKIVIVGFIEVGIVGVVAPRASSWQRHFRFLLESLTLSKLLIGKISWALYVKYIFANEYL